jgi:hypothetical protein
MKNIDEVIQSLIKNSQLETKENKELREEEKKEIKREKEDKGM